MLHMIGYVFACNSHHVGCWAVPGVKTGHPGYANRPKTFHRAVRGQRHAEPSRTGTVSGQTRVHSRRGPRAHPGEWIRDSERAPLVHVVPQRLGAKSAVRQRVTLSSPARPRVHGVELPCRPGGPRIACGGGEAPYAMHSHTSTCVPTRCRNHHFHSADDPSGARLMFKAGGEGWPSLATAACAAAGRDNGRGDTRCARPRTCPLPACAQPPGMAASPTHARACCWQADSAAIATSVDAPAISAAVSASGAPAAALAALAAPCAG